MSGLTSSQLFYFLPDVNKEDILYTFKGDESWQPLTELQEKKCKRCGFYEEHTLQADDVFDEWEICPSDFIKSDGKYIYFKDEEFNATFSCPECVPRDIDSDDLSGSQRGGKGIDWVLIVVISVLVPAVL